VSPPPRAPGQQVAVGGASSPERALDRLAIALARLAADWYWRQCQAAEAAIDAPAPATPDRVASEGVVR